MRAVPDDPIHIEQAIWTEADFDVMGWHDVALHAIAIEPDHPHPGRLALDIDYLLKWVPPESSASAFRFWISPATLVFDQASDLVVDLDCTGRSFEPSVRLAAGPCATRQSRGRDAIGLANGLITTRLGIPSFIATLGMMFVLRGVIRFVSINPKTNQPDSIALLSRRAARSRS